jgi:hypothetical protein
VVPQITTAAAAQTMSFSLGSNSLNLGTLSSSAASTGTHTLTVATSATSGMVVTVSGATLTSGAYTIDAMASATTSSAGTEQFGINLVANTSPTTFGANATGTPTIGVAATGYATANNFKFVTGATIASSSGAVNSTVFTVSYLANIKATTEGGTYTTTLTYVVTSTF